LLSTKVDGINTNIGDNNTNVTNLQTTIKELQATIIELNSRILAVEAYGTTNVDFAKRIETLESKYNKITAIESDITGIKERLDNIDTEHEELYSGV